MTDNTFPPPPESPAGAPLPPIPPAGAPIPPPPGYQDYTVPPQQYAQPRYAQPGMQPPPPTGPKKGLAIAALVLGIVAILGAWIPFAGLFSVVLGIAGLVLGIVALVKANRGQAGGRAMAIVGAVLGGLSIVVGIASTVIAVVAITDASDEIGGDWESLISEIEEGDSWVTADPTFGGAGDETTAAIPEGEPGSFTTPGVIGDGTVWTIEDSGDEWQLTIDSLETVEGFSGKVALITGTATPTVITTGDTSSWTTFPTIQAMAHGELVADTYDPPMNAIDPAYLPLYDLEAPAGTTMKFYATVGLPDGVTADTVVVTTFWDGESLYVSSAQ